MAIKFLTAAQIDGTFTISSIANASSDTDKFLVSDSGIVKYRTGTQLRSDIGAGTGSGSVTSVTVQGTTGLAGSGTVTTSGTITLTNSDRGSSQAIYKNIATQSGTATASSNTATLTITGTGGTTTSRSGDTITINSTDNNDNYYVSSATFATATGILTLNRHNTTSITVDLDGRWLELAGGTMTGAIAMGNQNITGGGTITGTTLTADSLSCHGAADIAGPVVISAGALSITGDGSNAATLTESGSGDFTIASVDDMRLDSGGNDIVLRGASSSEFGRLTNETQDFVIRNITGDKDILFKGVDNATTITAFKLDMSEAGSAVFNDKVTIGSIPSVGSDTNKFLMSNSGVVSYATGAEVLSYIGAGTGGGSVTSIGLTGDSGSTNAITSSGTFKIAGGTNVTTSASGGTVTINSTDQYSGTVTGTGTANKMTKWSGTSAITDSSVTDDGTDVNFISPIIITDSLADYSTPFITLWNDTNGGGAGFEFSDQATTHAQKGYLTFYHSDGSSQGGGASLHATSTETDFVMVVGGPSTNGRFSVYSGASNAEPDYGFYDDQDTGMLRSAANAIRFVTGGAASLDLGISSATFVGTVTTGGTVTTDAGNSTQWDTAYDNMITGFSDSGTSTVTLTLTQQDGGTLTTSFSVPQGTGDGTVTSVGSGAGLTGGTITTSGSLAVDYTGSDNIILAATDDAGGAIATNDYLITSKNSTNDVEYHYISDLPFSNNSGDLTGLTAGTAISITSPTGPVPTINNTGVTGLAGSTGISVSQGAGNVSLTNTGVTSIVAGSNISVSGATGAVTVSSTDQYSGTVTSIATGAGLSGGTITATGTLVLDVNSSTTTTSPSNADWFSISNTAGVTYKIAPGNIYLSTFGNDSGWTSYAEPGIFSGGGTPTLASGVTALEIRTLIGAGTSSSTGTVTSVTATAPLTSTGGTTPVIAADFAVVNSGSSKFATGAQIQTAIDAAVTGALKYIGVWNASTNSPTLSSGSGTVGNYYIVSVAGSTNLDGITDWAVGDWAVFSDQATDAWQKIDNTQVGNVTGSGSNTRLAVWNSASNLTSDSDFYVDGDTIFTTNLEAFSAVTWSGGGSDESNSAYDNMITAISDSGSSTITLTLTQQDGGTLTTSFSNPQGTVTSVATAGTENGLTLTGGTITSSGTITLGGTLVINNDDWSGTDLSVVNGGTGASTSAAALTNLGASTIGAALFKTLADDTTIRFIRINADESVSALEASAFRTAIGAGTGSGSGSVTSVATGSGLTGGTITTSGTLSHADTSSQASASNSGRTFIQSITLDTFGHITALESATDTDTHDGTVKSISLTSDSGTTTALTATGSFDISGGTNVTTSASGGTVTINSVDQYQGTVTSVGTTGTVSGLTLTGTVTTSGTLTLGGTLSLTSANVTSGLGFTPYNATNPSGYTTNTGTTTASNSQTFTNKGGNISQWTNNSGYITSYVNTTYTAGTGLLLTGTVFSNTITNNNQLTNGAGYTTNTGTTTPSNSQTFTNKGGNISQWTNDSGYTTNAGTMTGFGVAAAVGGSSFTISNGETLSLVGGTNITASFNSSNESITFNNDITNNNQLTNGAGYVTSSGGSMSTWILQGDSGSNLTVSNGNTVDIAGGTNITTTATATGLTITNGITNNNQLTNGSGYTTNTGTTTASNSQTFTNKGGNISQWTNNSGYTTASGTVTSVQTGAGIHGGTITTSGQLILDINSSTTTTTNSNADWFSISNTGGTTYKIAPANISLSTMSNDSGWTTNTGTVDTTGTPANNQVAVWTDSNTLEGDVDLTFDGSSLTMGGNLIVEGGLITLSDSTPVMSNQAEATLLKIGDIDGNDTTQEIQFHVFASNQLSIEDGQCNFSSELSMDSGYDIRLNGDSNILLDTSIAANQSSGIILLMGSTSVTVNKVYYWTAASTWGATNANSALYSIGLIAYANSSGTASSGRMVTSGVVFSSGHGFTIGAPLYLAASSGLLSNTAPSGNGHIARVVGYAITSDEIYFNPDNTWVKISA